MKLQLTLLTILTTAVVACNKASTASTDANASALGAQVLVTGPYQLAPGAQGQIGASGGTGVFIDARASQGTLIPSTVVGANAWTYTAPTAATSSIVTIYITDSAGVQGQWNISLTGVTTTPGTGSTFTSTSCAGSFTITDQRASGQLVIVQNASNQISGYLAFPSLGWTYPIVGSCSVAVGAASGTISFQNVARREQYTGTLTLVGGAPRFTGSAVLLDDRTGAQSSVGWVANGTVLSAPPVAETQACGGTYNASFGLTPGVPVSSSNPGSPGQIILVHNGAGIVAGYQVRTFDNKSVVYSMSGTCGSNLNLTNNTNGTTYSGTGFFTGSSATLSGQFVTRATNVSPSATYFWSASK